MGDLVKTAETIPGPGVVDIDPNKIMINARIDYGSSVRLPTNRKYTSLTRPGREVLSLLDFDHDFDDFIESPLSPRIRET